jgi:hypothetical protein
MPNLPQPPRSASARFDDWLFVLWKSVSGANNATNSPAQGASTITGSQTLNPGNGAYVPGEMEIAAQATYEIGLGSTLEIG